MGRDPLRRVEHDDHAQIGRRRQERLVLGNRLGRQADSLKVSGGVPPFERVDHVGLAMIDQQHAGQVLRVGRDDRADVRVVELAQVLHEDGPRHAGRGHRRAHFLDRLVLREAAMRVGVDDFH